MAQMTSKAEGSMSPNFYTSGNPFIQTEQYLSARNIVHSDEQDKASASNCYSLVGEGQIKHINK